jgi:N-acyl homoserine lactone hydrolase
VTEVDVHPVVTATMKAPHPYFFRPPGGNWLTRLPGVVRPDGEPIVAPLLAYVVRHPDAGPILIDTGLHPDAAESLRGDFGAVLSTLFRGLRSAGEPYEEQLRGLGVEPDDAELVVMTHLHVDHTGGMRLLPNAEFVCSTAEWEAATGARPALGGYASAHLPDSSRVRLVDVEREGEPHAGFARTHDLLGDGSIRLVSTPGHTPGHLSVLLRATGGRRVLVVGDAAYTLRSIREQLPPLLTANDRRYRMSLADLKRFSESHPDATLVPTHDPDAWRQLETVSA